MCWDGEKELGVGYTGYTARAAVEYLDIDSCLAGVKLRGCHS